MSPLARSLLVLACAALLHASSADLAARVHAEIPNIDVNNCGKLVTGKINDTRSEEVTLDNIYVPPRKLLKIPNVAKPDEVLIGQRVLACDPTGLAKKVTLTPVSPHLHSPIKIHCEPKGACPKGVVAFAEQYVIKKNIIDINPAAHDLKY